MSLRYIVPALGAFAFVGAPADAIEVGDLSIGGFTDAIFTYQDVDAEDDPDIGFSGDVELQFAYAIGSNVTARTDLEFGEAAGGKSGSGQAYVEAADVTWAINEQFSLTMGRFENWLGYELEDAPDRMRINNSLLFDANGVDTDGLAGTFSANDELTVGVFVTDTVYGSAAGSTKNISFGARVDYIQADMFSLALNVQLDDGGDEPEDWFGLNISGDYTGVENLTVYGDITSQTGVGYVDESLFGILIGASYGFQENMAGVLDVSMLSYDESEEEELQIAGALITNPTGDSNFAVNYELTAQTHDQNDGADFLRFAVEFLAVIP